MGESMSAFLTSRQSVDENNSLKLLRTNIMSMRKKMCFKSLVISSANQADGKTTIAVALAKSFAATGEKVLLIDADGSESDAKASLMNDSERVDSEGAIISSSIDGLDVLSIGSIANTNQVLPNDKKMLELMEDLENKFDFILVDTPAINENSNALILANVVGYLLLVVRKNKTLKRDFDQVIDKLKLIDTHTIGVAMNEER